MNLVVLDTDVAFALLRRRTPDTPARQLAATERSLQSGLADLLSGPIALPLEFAEAWPLADGEPAQPVTRPVGHRPP